MNPTIPHDHTVHNAKPPEASPPHTLKPKLAPAPSWVLNPDPKPKPKPMDNQVVGDAVLERAWKYLQATHADKPIAYLLTEKPLTNFTPHLNGKPCELSFHSQPQGCATGGQLFRPKPLSQFKSNVSIDEYLVTGILARGRKTLFVGRGKDTGKTTWWSHVMRHMDAGGEFCGLKIEPTKMVCFS
jgi:hypothetical protein